MAGPSSEKQSGGSVRLALCETMNGYRKQVLDDSSQDVVEQARGATGIRHGVGR
jgi:hypothetical protein